MKIGKNIFQSKQTVSINFGAVFFVLKSNETYLAIKSPFVVVWLNIVTILLLENE
jgi:hypothetical protein